MKKYVFIMLIALFSILSLNEAKGQDCPAGFEERPYSVMIAGCLYNVLVCVDCNVAYSSEVHFKERIKADPNCTQSLTESEVDYKIKNDLLSIPRLNSLCDLPGPCDISPRTFYVYMPICYKIENNTFKDCETLKCRTFVTICWDIVLNKFVTTRNSSLIGDPNACPNTFPPINPNDCFNLNFYCGW